ncbi:hypothetical protein GCM10027184_26170 [Saccharothrix stipae]
MSVTRTAYSSPGIIRRGVSGAEYAAFTAVARTTARGCGECRTGLFTSTTPSVAHRADGGAATRAGVSAAWANAGGTGATSAATSTDIADKRPAREDGPMVVPFVRSYREQ